MSKAPFSQFGPMIDCSRNAVLNLESTKKMLDICKAMGFNSYFLYIEDTYEIPDLPYFGYARGRYSIDELSEINAYGNKIGVEVIPCIQTLGHLNAIFRWAAFSKYRDCNDILLIGNDEVYELIDKMFAVMSKCFTTKTINVGMDEAHMVGRGKYYDLHGDSNKTEILVSHIKKIAEIAKKYGYTITMWSDMFFRIASKGDYYNPKVTVSDELRAMIPDNVNLIYWDYYHYDKSFYDSMIDAHEKIKSGTVFAGVVGTCRGLTPYNAQKIAVTKPAIKSCLAKGIKNVMLTSWGDDGGENSRFAALPSMFYAACIARGITSIREIRELFKKQFGISYNAFMLLDLVDGDLYTTDSKNLLYNDVFIGLLDPTIEDGRGEKYAAVARKLARYKNNPDWGYLFETAHALCRVIELKAEMGKRIREAYVRKDKDALSKLIPELSKIIARINKFHKAYRKQWFIENKTTGFEIQDIRIGGLIKRIETCRDILSEYIRGEILEIPELSAELLNPLGNGEPIKQEPLLITSYREIVSANDIFTYNY